MNQPNEQLIETIEKALEEATPGPLDAEKDKWPGNDNLEYWVGNHMDGIGAYIRYEDAYLAANAPEWLRALLEERKIWKPLAEVKYVSLNKGDEEDRYFLQEEVIRLKAELQQTRKELEQIKEIYGHVEMDLGSAISERNDLQTELERVKAERDKLNEEKGFWLKAYTEKIMKED